jgi:hypothetical protein
MELNEIKKLLYKENPVAKFMFLTKDAICYTAGHEDSVIVFTIPQSDVDNGIFKVEMDSKHLIRWINSVNKIPNDEQTN